jgi:hypothetical protein
MKIGGFIVTALETDVAVEGETVSGTPATGTARLLRVSDSAGCDLTVRDTRWDTGERDLVATERHDSPQRFDTLVERLRLAVSPLGGELYAELRHVRLKPNARGNLFAPNTDELDDAAGVAVTAELYRHGATRVGTRAELLADEGRTRNRLGVMFPRDADEVAIAAYVYTRLAPVARGVTA